MVIVAEVVAIIKVADIDLNLKNVDLDVHDHGNDIAGIDPDLETDIVIVPIEIMLVHRLPIEYQDERNHQIIGTFRRLVLKM